MNVIESKDLAKRYLGRNALDGMSFSFEENKIIGLIGRNGAGKTTLLKIISGFIKKTSGEIKVFSEEPFNSLNVSINSIFVDDQISFPPAMQLREILEVSKSFYPKWDTDLAKRLFDYFSFDGRYYHNRLSKGQKSTFNMIIGLTARCPLTIFDEPTTGMDEAVRKDFYRALLKDYIAHPRTIILSSHHLSEIEDLLEEILLIKNGKVLLQMPISDLKEWAIALKGKRDEVLQWIAGMDILYENHIGMDTMYVVVKNDFSNEELDKLRLSGVELSQVGSSDLCVYLTNDSKGGIDDVFNHD